MNNYLDLALKIVKYGDIRDNERTGTGTRSLFGQTLRYDLHQGFPLVTTKRVNFKAVVNELLWFLSGSTNVNDLDSKIWDEWADENGDLGPIYGHQWKKQLPRVMESLRNDPEGRRHIVNCWQLVDLAEMRLPPCHVMYQFYIANGELSCQMYQRSADVFLGVPFNIASYALLTHLVAATLRLDVGKLHIVFGDAHVYTNHIDQVKEQWMRRKRYLPTISINRKDNLFDYTTKDIVLEGYNPHPAIKGEISI